MRDAIAVAARYRHRVQVLSLDAQSSTTYANPDGSLTADLSSVPVRVHGAGGWVAPDATLTARSDGAFVPRAAVSSVVLGAVGSRDVLMVPMGGGSLTYTWPTPLPKPTVAGTQATYAEVLAGVDLRVDVGVEASHVSVVIKHRPATPLRSLDWGVRLTNLTASEAQGGTITYKTLSGKVAGYSAGPLAWDSATRPHVGGFTQVPVHSSLKRVGQWPTGKAAAAAKQVRLAVQRLTMPTSLLDDPATRYPVTIDPASTPAEADYTYIDSAYPTQAYTNNTEPTDQNGGHVHVGLSPGPGGQVTRGLFRFTPSGLVGKTIETARLATTGVWSWTCPTPIGSTLVYGTAEWSSSAVAWNTQPATLSTGAVPSASWAAGYNSSCPIRSSSPGFDVLAIVRAENTGAYSHFNFELRSDSEGNYQAWHKFSGSATLSITYNSPPSTPTYTSFVQPTAACATTSGSAPSFNNLAQALTIQAWLADADNNNLRWDITIKNASTGAIVSSPQVAMAAPGWRQYAIPKQAAYLSDGGLYAWKSSSYDGTTSSAESAYCYFRIRNTGPAKPQIWTNLGGASAQASSPESIPVGSAQTQTVTFKPGSTADQVSKYVYSFNQAPPAMAPTGQSGSFVPLAGRLMDTRNGTGGYSSAFAANSWRSLQASGVLGVPSGISAVEISLTVIGPSANGYLSADADGSSPSHVTSAIDYAANQTVTNAALVPVAANGKIDIFASTVTNVIVDVEGYYTAPSGATGGLHAMTAVRAADSRYGTGMPQARLSTGSVTSVSVSNAVPAVPTGTTVTAVFANITVLSYSATDAGYLTAYPTGSTRPVSSLNYPAAATYAIGSAVDVSNDGTASFNLYVGGTTQPVDVIIDVQAYFLVDASNNQAGEFTPANVRAYDSRTPPNTSIPANGTRIVPIAGAAVGGVPANAVAYIVNMTVVAGSSAQSGYVDAWPNGGPEPSVSDVNFSANTMRSNVAVLAADPNGQIQIKNHSGAAIDIVIDVEGWYSDNTGYTVVPATSNVASTSITFANGVHTLWVCALDSTGNISTASSVVFTVFRDGDPASTGHGWLTDFDPGASSQPEPPAHPSTAPTAAPDSSLNVGNGGVGGTALTLEGSTLPPFIEEAPLAPRSGAVGGDRTVWGLHFNGVDQDAVTTDAAGSLVDTSDNFTVSAWVKPAASGNAQATAVSLDADGGSAFLLGVDSGRHWQFCVPANVLAPAAADCANSTSSYLDTQQSTGTADITAQGGTWYFVMGFYDHVTQTINLVVSASGADTQFYSRPYTTTPAMHDRPQLVLGRDRVGGSPNDWFAGDIVGASVFQGSRGVPGNDVRINQLLNLTAPRAIPHPVPGS